MYDVVKPLIQGCYMISLVPVLNMVLFLYFTSSTTIQVTRNFMKNGTLQGLTNSYLGRKMSIFKKL